jgi:hypothetical protein
VSTENATDPLSQRPERDAGLPLFGNVCVECGGYVKAGRLRCATCRGEPDRPRSLPGSLPIRSAAPGSSFQFSIETLLLVTTFIAVCLGACVAVPPIGVPLSVIAVAALIRTLIVGQQRLAAQAPFPVGEKVAEYLVSLFVVAGAIGVGFLTLLTIACIGGIIAAIVWSFGPPETPAEEVAFFFLGCAFWLSVLFGPLAAGIWFGWTTRPRG